MKQQIVAFTVTSCILITLSSPAASLAVMSIDLGNEFMKIGLVKPGVPMEIVLNADSARKTATVVALRKADDREFGNPALNTAVRYPTTAFMFLRDLLAKNMSSPLVKEFQQRFPYYKMEDDLERASIIFEHPDGSKYSTEELLAMILESAKQYAETFAEQKISDAVIVCPVYFNQAERRALKRSAELAGIKVLQLMTSPSAVALNYGVFRRSEFNSTEQSYMFFDMGSTSTTATIVSYQVVKMKVGSIVETNPQLTIRGVGVDRTLGSLEMTMRLRTHLAKLFNEQKKTSKNVFESPRSMAKLLKEAERVKKILSANTETFAQVENLLDEQDFKAKVTREEFELMCADLFDRIAGTIEEALKTSEMTLAEINEVILMGGGTRVHKVKQKLQEAVKREELGKSINTDEAAALGAVYQAAHLSTGFRVKTFAVKDANLYPIQVDFERTRVDDDGVESTKVVRRTLFSRMNPYPQKKVMTFNKHTSDFNFNVNYGDLGFLSEAELQSFGSLNLSSVSLEGVGDEINKHVDNFTESKGVKAHFRLDDSGFLHMDSVEVVFERMPDPASEESTLSKLSNTISNFFGSGKADDKEGAGTADDGTAPQEDAAGEQDTADKKTDDSESADGTENKPSEKSSNTEGADEQKKEEASEKKTDETSKEEAGKTPDEEKPDEMPQEKKTDEAPEEKTADAPEEKTTPNDGDKEKTTTDAPAADGNDTSTAANTTASSGEVKPQVIKRNIKSTLVVLDGEGPSTDHLQASKDLLADLTRKDEEKKKLAAVKNELESFSYDVRNKLYEEDYEACSTEEERDAIREKLTEIMDWYDEQPLNTGLQEYEEKLKEAKKLIKDLNKKVKEYRDRPKAMADLKSTLNHTKYLMKSMQNYSLVAPDGEGPFTEVELKTLEDLYTETKNWMENMKKEQKSKSPTDTPAYTVEDVAAKIGALDREMKYLLNKARIWKPKKPDPKKDTNSTKTSNSTQEPEPTGSESSTDQPEQNIDVPDTTESTGGEETQEVEPTAAHDGSSAGADGETTEEPLQLPGAEDGGDDDSSKTDNNKDKDHTEL